MLDNKQVPVDELGSDESERAEMKFVSNRERIRYSVKVRNMTVIGGQLRWLSSFFCPSMSNPGKPSDLQFSCVKI